jgi:signal peptidase
MRPPVSGPWALLAALALVYLATNLLIPRLLSGGWNLYFAQPLLWLGLAWYCVRQDRDLLTRPSALLLTLALLAGLFQVGLFALAGLLYGFGYSGYSHEPAAAAANVFYLTSVLAGTELARAFLLRRLGGSLPAVTAIVLLFGGLALTIPQLQGLTAGGRPAFEVGGGTLLPATAESFVATELALAGGPWLAIAYRAVPLFAEWLSPVLPQLDWMLGAMVRTAAPVIALLALRPALTGPADEFASAAKGVPAWALLAAAMIAGAVWLNTGLLGVRPALVSGASMEPNFVLGDIVLTRPVAPESLRPGDVIRFRDGAVSIVHRVVSVHETPAGLVFHTRGDNNDFTDPPVPESAVEGRVVLTVPKLGLLPIELKTLLQEAAR